MKEHEIREARKQGIRLRVREHGQPKSIEAGALPRPGEAVVLVSGARDIHEARRVFEAWSRAVELADSELGAMRKTDPGTYLELMDALDRVTIELELDVEGKVVTRG